MVRYADDAVLGFQKPRDARECLEVLKGRLEKFGLKVHPEKTRLVCFGRLALSHNREERGKPGTFDFLGFTHYIGQTRAGKAVVMRKTKRGRQLAQLKAIRQAFRKRLHERPAETGHCLRRVMEGHINYYRVILTRHIQTAFVS